MLFSRPPFKATHLRIVVVPVLLAATLGGCGGERDEDTRLPRAVLVTDFAYSQDSNKTIFLSRDGVWQRPAAAIEQVTPTDVPDITTCDHTYPTTDPATVLGPTVDSACSVISCKVTSGLSRYTTVLGGFSIMFINNSTKNPQNMAIEGVGVNIHISNSAGAEVWNYTRDNLDYKDWIDESSYLLASMGGDACRTKIQALSAGYSIPTAVRFGTEGYPYSYTLSPANSEDMVMTFGWDGKDSSGNDVPAGDYTAHFEMTVTDTDTGTTWESPADLSFSIAD